MKSHQRIKNENMSIIGITCFLLASKFDEIDYQLPSIRSLLRLMNQSKYLSSYCLKFRCEDIASCEEEVTKNVLDWNLAQLTPYHFCQNFIT